MPTRRPPSLVALAAALAAAPTLSAQSAPATPHAAHAPAPDDSAARLGSITFPTASAPAAHAAFERGVLYLHNFHYAQAAASFRRARALDSADVLSTAFEALTHTHPVWNQQNSAAARQALRTIAPTRAARLARARTPRERGWMDAVEALYDGEAPKPVRDSAFSRAMAALHAADPSDAEAASFYALSLLGLNQGVREPVAYAGAEAIADSVLRVHPRHPGALHYKIHAVDDPASAQRGLAAARRYGEVAPGAGHALHMTSHIHIALGRWDDVVSANRRAGALNPHVFGHGTHWLVYGLIQQGRVREARAWVDSMLAFQRAASARGSAVRGLGDIAAHAVLIPATWVADAEGWDTPLATAGRDTAHLPGVALRTMADYAVAYPAARRAARPVDVVPGSRAADRRLADSLLARMTARHARAAGAARSDLGEAVAMETALRGELAWAAQRRDSAVALLRAAATAWEALPFAFGPPGVVKPPRERAAEMLLVMGRAADALVELDLGERMTPGRTQSLLRRGRALGALGRRDEARRVYATLDSIWRGADSTFPFAAEARWGAGRLPAVVRAARLTSDTLRFASGPLTLGGARWRPAGAGRHPALVVLHGSGGCWSAGEVDELGQRFAAHGYVAFFPCRRGLGLSTGQGEAVLDQLRRELPAGRDALYAARSTELLRTTQLDDVRAAIAAIRARPEVDAARVAVTGVSYGGILTLLAAGADPTLRAAVAFAPGAMNWAWNTPLRDHLTSVARRTRVPTLVLQAENDWSVGPTTEIPAAMRAGGGEARGHLYPAMGANAGEGHGLMMTGADLWQDELFRFLDPRLRPPTVAGRARR